LIVEHVSSQHRLCLYDPVGHALRILDVDLSHVDALVMAIDRIVPIQQATLLWFIAQVDRTLSKYEHGESLIWRDAGALLTTLSLVATALDLSCCAIGATNDQVLEALFQAGDRLIDVGSFLVGTI
jgi:SagB-type dehydrogenase family enzyme